MKKKPAEPTLDTKARELVDRAIRTAVAEHDMVERRIRPESLSSWTEPAPLAGLRAALAVAHVASRRAHEFAAKLRGEGRSWRDIADLLDVPYSEEYSRAERAYEIVLGPEPAGSSSWHHRSVYWSCGGPLGCGGYIADGGPYNGTPIDNERNHSAGCRRLQAEHEDYLREIEESERRHAAAEAAFKKIADTNEVNGYAGRQFDVDTVHRARWTVRHGGEIQGRLSTSERLAVALVLDDNEYLREVMNYNWKDAVRRVYGDGYTPAQIRNRLALLRTATTGEVRSRRAASGRKG